MDDVCFSKRNVEDFLRRKDLPKSVRAHAEQAMRSFDAPIPIFRTLEEFEERLPGPVPTYDEVTRLGCNALNVMNCHNGQRKLIMSVLEFVVETLKHLKCEPPDLVIVYAGASGMAAVIAAKLFPGLKFVLYDPAPNTLALIDPSIKIDKVVYRTPLTGNDKIDLSRDLVICTGRAGWFDDEVAKSLRVHLQSLQKAGAARRVAFISDVRVSNEENNIVQDMLDQQTWTHSLGAEAYMFKFRIPYADLDAQVEKYVAANRVWCPKLPAVPGGKSRGANHIPYLDGKLHLQLYARPMTAELRLIGFAKNKPPGKYGYRMYNLKDIENKMAAFNLVYRSNARFGLSDRKAAMPPRATYEAVAEHDILRRMSLVLSEKAEELRDQVDRMMSRFINKTWISCALASAANRLGNAREKCDKGAAERVGRCRARTGATQGTRAGSEAL